MYKKRFCVIVLSALILTALLAGCLDSNPTTTGAQQTPSQENAAKKEVEAKETASNPKPAVTHEQMKDMQEALNELESGNKYSPLYSGVECGIKANGGERVVVYVTDVWNDISKDEKIGYVNHIAQVWAGMHGARRIALDMNLCDVQIKHADSGRIVGTWNGVWGPSIKD